MQQVISTMLSLPSYTCKIYKIVPLGWLIPSMKNSLVKVEQSYAGSIESGGGNEADKCIEQDLMRLIKSRGGLTRGRGITESTMETFTGSLPTTVSYL